MCPDDCAAGRKMPSQSKPLARPSGRTGGSKNNLTSKFSETLSFHGPLPRALLDLDSQGCLVPLPARTQAARLLGNLHQGGSSQTQLSCFLILITFSPEV